MTLESEEILDFLKQRVTMLHVNDNGRHGDAYNMALDDVLACIDMVQRHGTKDQDDN